MAKLVSGTYGEALFTLSLEENKIDAMNEEVLAVREIFQQNEELLKLLTHPRVSEEEKITLIENIFKDRVSEEMTGFFVELAKKGRFGEVDAIFEYFLEKVREYKNIGVVYVTSAIALTDMQKKQVEEKLLQVTKYEKCEMHYQTDEKLIGGMVIRIGDRVMDGSIRTRLSDMAKAMANVQLH